MLRNQFLSAQEPLDLGGDSLKNVTSVLFKTNIKITDLGAKLSNKESVPEWSGIGS